MRRCEAVSLFSVASLAALARPGTAAAQGPLEKIRVAGPPTEDMTNLYYAIKTGMFQRAGLDVSMVPTGSGAAATAAVIVGTYELAKTSLLAVFAAHLREIPIAIVAPEIVHTPRNRVAEAELQIATDANYKTGADLNGKTIGVPALGDVNTLATRAWVDKNGGDWRSLKFVEIPNSALEAAIVQHRIDAAMLQSPQLDFSLAAGTTKTLGDGYGAVAPSFMSGAYVARTDWASQHADSLRRFTRVYVDATTYVNNHPAETVPLVHGAP